MSKAQGDVTGAVTREREMAKKVEKLTGLQFSTNIVKAEGNKRSGGRYFFEVRMRRDFQG
jgi:hypothetical protein